MNIGITTDLSKMDVKGLEDKLKAVVQIAARNVEAGAKETVPVDTGATKNSIYVDPGTPSMQQLIGPTTEYAPFLEFGTRHMIARPFLIPALEKERNPFINAISQVFRRFGQ